MRVVTFSHSAPGGGFALAAVADPEPASGEVRIRVAAAGVNRADLLQREGKYPPPAGVPEWPGLEVSGVVDEVRDGTSRFSPGDPVCALLPGGGYAEMVVAPEMLVLPAPAGIPLVESAGLMEAACTVWSSLRRAGAAGGETLLVHGGSGGIGTTAIQLGKAWGMRVWATARTRERADRCEALGADVTVAYAEQPAAALRDLGEADVILDVMGGSHLAANLDQLATGGRLIVIGLQGGRRGELDLATLMTKRASVLGTTLRARPLEEKARIVAQVERDVWPWVPTRYQPVVHAVMPFEEAEAAHAALALGEAFGKVLLTP